MLQILNKRAGWATGHSSQNMTSSAKGQIELLYPFLEENLRHGVATVEEIDMLATNFVKEEYQKKIANRDNPALQK